MVAVGLLSAGHSAEDDYPGLEALFDLGRSERLASGVAAALGVPASSMSIAFVDALRHLGLHRVAIAASYPEDVARHFVRFLTAGGAEVVSMGSKPVLTANQVTVWKALQLVGPVPGLSGLGTLFAAGDRK